MTAADISTESELGSQHYLEHARSLEFKIRLRRTRGLIEYWAGINKVLVMSSWGKDAVALVHLSRSIVPRHRLGIVHAPYGVSMAGYEAPKKQLTKGVEYVELPAAGAGEIRDRWEEAYNWARKNGYHTVLHGHRMDEGIQQAITLASFLVLRPGPGSSCNRKPGLLRAWPLAQWTAADVWAYIYAFDVPYNREVYDSESHGFTRETIRSDFGQPWAAGDDPGYTAWLHEHFPERAGSRSRQDAAPAGTRSAPVRNSPHGVR